MPRSDTRQIHEEEWRPIPGFPGYEVSGTGRVLSHRRAKPALLKFSMATNGYWKVSLMGAGGRVFNRNVHVLVAEAFHGPRPEWAHLVRHRDGDPLNNVASNLAWGTHSENAQDRIKHGNDWQVRKTACIHGHPFAPSNTYITPEGARRCRVCHRRRDNESKARRALRAAGIEVAA